MTRYEHKGGAVPTTLSAEVAPDALTIPISASDGWPDGTVGPFWVSINKGSLTEEKVLCSARTGLVLQVLSDVGGTGRGRDDTVAHNHPINSPVEHIWTATEADEANAHVNSGDGAHGYPAKATLVTLDGDQHITGTKTMDAPVLHAPTLDAPAATGGTHTGATKMSLTGPQAEAEFRVRNVYIGTAAPSDSLGSDGDLYIKRA